MTQLNVTLTAFDEQIWILHLTGTVDSSTHRLMWSADSSTLLAQQLVEAKAKTLIVELTDVERIDSQGLGIILNAYKEFSSHNIDIILRNPNPHLFRLFRLMQFDQVFTIEFSE